MRFKLIVFFVLVSLLLSQNNNRIIVVSLDDISFSALSDKYPYPYPRGKVWGNAIKNISILGAKVIVIDLLFDAPDFVTQMKYFVRDEMLNGNYSTIQEKESLEKVFTFEDEDKLLADAILESNINGTDVIFSAKIEPYFISNRRYDKYSLLIPSQTISNKNLSNIKFGIDSSPFFNNSINRFINDKYPISFNIPEGSDYCYYSLAMKVLLNYYNLDDNCYTDDRKKHFNYKPFKNDKDSFLTYPLINILDDDQTCFGKCFFDEEEKIYIPDDSNSIDDDWVNMMMLKSNLMNEDYIFKDKVVILGSSLPEHGNFESIYNLANRIQQLIDTNYIQFFKD